jgi:rSAM/selenodomain-associated transferase 2
MISVVIPTRNAERRLAATLTALVPAVVDGTVREVIVVDCGSTDATRTIADAAGARLIETPEGRGVQLQSGAAAARHPWLLFLHADTVLEANWHDEVAGFIEKMETDRRVPSAAAFRFALDGVGLGARIIERGVGIRCFVCAMPYGDQGLLISRQLYDEIGGFKPVPLFEDVDIVRRIGRQRLSMLRARATTSAVRYQRGYARRVLRNWVCFVLYSLGVSTKRLEKIYNG